MDHVSAHECDAGCWFEGDNMGTVATEFGWFEHSAGRCVEHGAELVDRFSEENQGAWKENCSGGSFKDEGLKAELHRVYGFRTTSEVLIL